MTDRETDVCIVGSGIAGAIVAQHCVQSGRSVLMVEAGGRVDGRHRILRLFESTIRDYRMARMKLFGKSCEDEGVGRGESVVEEGKGRGMRVTRTPTTISSRLAEPVTARKRVWQGMSGHGRVSWLAAG